MVLDTLYGKAVQADSKVPVLSLAAYLELGKIDSILARFVEDKVNAHEDADRIRQVLKAMVTPEGTRRIGSKAEIAENAAQFGEPVSEDDLTPLLNSLIDDRIIREDADNHLFELRHDTLALTIRQWMTGLEQELMEVRQTIENRYKEFTVRGTLMDAAALEYIAPYESRLRLKAEMAEFVEKSRKEAARRRRRWLTFAGCVVALFVGVVSSLGIYGYVKSIEADEQRLAAEANARKAGEREAEAKEREIQARHNVGLVFNEKAGKALDEKNFNVARLYSLHALAMFDPKRQGPEIPMAASRILNHVDYKLLYTSPDGSHHTASVTSVVYSPDGSTLASGSWDNTIRLWDVLTGKERAVLTGHTGSVRSVVYSPDGSTLASGSYDKTISLYDLAWHYDTTPLEKQIEEAERRYNLSLVGLDLQLVSQPRNLYGTATPSPQWPKTHPFHWLPAAENGDLEAMVELGLCYDRNNDNGKALIWYQKAADAGSARGKERLEFLREWMQRHPR